jgi:hypothetical protein
MMFLALILSTLTNAQTLLVEKKTFDLPEYRTVSGEIIAPVRVGYDRPFLFR